MTRKKPMWAIWVQIAALACFDWQSAAAPVSSSTASKVVSRWLATDPTPLAENLGPHFKSIETFHDLEGTALYHLIHLAPTGFVLVAADDRMGPIVAFGARGDFDLARGNALMALAEKDLKTRLALARAHPGAAGFLNARKRWRAFLEGWPAPPTGNSPLLTNISMIQVAPFLQTLWDQNTVGHDTDVACYNYYTPPLQAGSVGNYPCGCVATAMAQLMYYFQYPVAGVGAASYGIIVDGELVSANLRGGDGAGGPYVWSNMPPVPQNPTAAQCQAIGALTYDAGLAVGMAYAPGDSETTLFDSRQALAETFSYSNAILGGEDNPNFSLSANLISMVNPNLDARLPVMLGIWANSEEGHCVLCDGYGYIGATLYHHLNLGFSGVDDGWYALPDFTTDSGLAYTNISSCVYNVYAAGAGEIISGRIVDGFGNAIPGATVTASRAGGGSYTAASDTNGIYALIQLPPNSQYALTASRTGYSNATGAWSTTLSQNGAASTGNVWGANFVLTAAGSPSILIGPQSQTVLAGGTAVFSVNAAGIGTLSYQWSRNGLSLADGGSALTITNASALNAGTYMVVVSNAFGAVASSGAVLNLVQAGGASLAQNGGFETGNFAGWQTAGNSADTFVTTGPRYVHAGAFGAALGPSGSLGFLSQNIPTTNGSSYVLSCWFDSPDGLTPNEFVVSWNGTNLFDKVNIGAAGWTNLQFLVAASSSSTPLEFGFRNDNSYFGLDAITVNTLVPLPLTPVSFAAGGVSVNGANLVLTLTNLFGQGTVVVQASEDLLQWKPVFTNPPALGGIVFTDSFFTNGASRYYRAVVESSP